MISTVSIVLALAVTFNAAIPVAPGNPGTPGKPTGNLNIFEKPRLDAFQKILPGEPKSRPENLHLSSFFNFKIQNRLKVFPSIIGNTSLFHGRTYDPEVGLYYYRNRYYHPELGRFLQPDPMGYKDSMNLYQAFGMNPINFVDPFGNQQQVTVTPEGAEFGPPMTVGEFWESLMEAGVSQEEALNIIAENTYYSKYFWDGSLVDRIKTHQMDLALTDSEARALGMEYNLTLKGPREQFGRLFRGEFKEFGEAALENIDRTFGDPENAALMFSGGVKAKNIKPYLHPKGFFVWKDKATGKFVKPIGKFPKGVRLPPRTSSKKLKIEKKDLTQEYLRMKEQLEFFEKVKSAAEAEDIFSAIEVVLKSINKGKK